MVVFKIIGMCDPVVVELIFDIGHIVGIQVNINWPRWFSYAFSF